MLLKNRLPARQYKQRLLARLESWVDRKGLPDRYKYFVKIVRNYCDGTRVERWEWSGIEQYPAVFEYKMLLMDLDV